MKWDASKGRNPATGTSILGVNSAVLLGLLAVVVGILVFQIRDHPRFSRVDELQHFDYVLNSPSAGVRVGQQYGLEAMKVVACRGIDLPGAEPGSPGLPDCGDPIPDPSLSHSNGYNTAYLHTPVYYSVTALLGEAVLRIPGVDSSLVAYRLVGAAWLAAGLSVIWYAMGLVGVGTWGRAALVGLLGVSPVVIHASAFLNPDATALLGGGLLLLALLKWELGLWPWWGVPVASTLAVLLKLTNAIAVGVLLAYLALRFWQQTRVPEQRQVRIRAREQTLAMCTSFAVTLGSVLAWRLWQGHRQLVEERSLPIFAGDRHDSFQWASLDDQLRAVVTPFREQWVPEGLPRSVLVPLGGVADIGLLVLLGAALAFAAAKSPYRAMVGGVVAGMVGMGLVTMISFHLALGLDTLTPGRYGLATLPFAAVAAAPVLRRSMWASLMVGTLACGTAAAMVVGVLAYGPNQAVAITPDTNSRIEVWCSTTASTYGWRWNPVPGASTYSVSLDGVTWFEQAGTTKSAIGHPPNTEAILHVRATNGQKGESTASGAKSCRTAPSGSPVVKCETTASSYTWRWNPVEGATRYRIRNDEAHPWFLHAGTEKIIGGANRDREAILHVQAGNSDGWNVEITGSKRCRTKS